MSKARLALFSPIEYKGQYFTEWDNFIRTTGVTKHLYKKYYLNGYDPEVNIGNKHPVKIPLSNEKRKDE
jgi:hypothetical protein